MRFRKTLTFFILATGLACALSAWAQKKPFTQEQVSNMVRDGFGDESGAKLIEQRGIDFAPVEDFVQSLKAAGASEAFLNALRAAKPPEPASEKRPLNEVRVFALLVGEVPSHRVAMLVKERGIDFAPTQDYLQEVRLGGGDDELISTLKSAEVTKPKIADPAAQARQAEILQHVARGAEFFQKRQYLEAELEYRAALKLDPQNADIFVSLGSVLLDQKKYDDAESAARGALRVNPNDARGHSVLGGALLQKGEWEGAIAEFREALRLNPNDRGAHNNLGGALELKGDWDGAIAEFREVLRLNPSLEEAHVTLGYALVQKGDWDGVIAEERLALRLNPNDDEAHSYLGVGLEKKGDRQGALKEYHAAYTLNAKEWKYKQNYDRLLRQVIK